eukprot:CAMPEP_0114435894 /NCGR_PEP_ID=MMETSP0103-20121206/13114_1 /TAXON_ID=37642 ORGANISM="Paraphysomonas imperforata, Strain PA2" /NCGR_SAMPLE_ID=MMETSP0103 /ASSEMBLY_ACC=CAM_ASM_000201 /LENGTH=1204 /DNA_ID=CAMNT_0001606031 /DNA_START=167 /DNA_END=3781 /DNA_ORIENTATION=+
MCTCAEGYSGLDCSEIPCPTGTAWVDKAQGLDSAHQAAECSNAGICDLSSGKCNCFPGYGGLSCQRLSCPNDCSNRGRCMSIRDASVYYGRDYDSVTTYAGDGKGFDYDAWDSRSLQICKCDYGFMGPDCSLVMCPKGDDPYTTGQNLRTISVGVARGLGRSFFGEIGIGFHGEIVYISLDSPSNHHCTASLRASPQFQDVVCDYTFVDTRMVFQITFNKWPLAPKQNNLYTHDGNPPITDFYCDISRADATTTCTFDDIQATNVQEYAFCSNRGICNFDTGICKCVDGLGGMACQNITSRYSASTNALLGKEVKVPSPDNFYSSAIRVNVQKDPASDFNFISATSNTTRHFDIRGDGQLSFSELRVLDSGINVARGGLRVESGGFTVSTDGAYVYSRSDTTSGLVASSTSTAFTDDALEIKSATTSSANTYLMRLHNRDDPKFSVRGDGYVEINGAGTLVTGGVSIVTLGLAVSGGFSSYDTGLKVTGGFTVSSEGWYTTNGITVPQNGLKSTGGVTIYGGMTVASNGIAITAGGSDISAGGLLISQNGATVASGGLKTTDGLSVNAGGLKVSTGVSIVTTGMKVTGGVTVEDNGFVGTNGLTVVTGGMKATGGLTVTNGAKVTSGITLVDIGLKVAQGASIEAAGMTATGGLTVASTGFYYGAQVSSGGMKITGGLSVASSGARLTGGLTVVDTGVYIETTGLTVAQNGMKVADGVTVLDSGVIVSSGGVKVTGGVTVGDSGIKITGGLTVANSLEVTADGATITAGGIRVVDGVTVHDSGLHMNVAGVAVTGGVSVQTVGAHITGGLTVVDTGVHVAANGGTIATGGLSVTGGFDSNELNIDLNGLSVTGGVSVESGGMKVTGGMTFSTTDGLQVAVAGMSVASPGMVVQGGVTLTNTGLHVTGGGMRITGGVTLADTGISVTGGLTVEDSGLVVTANGVSVVGYMSVNDGITVEDTGLTVEAGGMKVTGGLSVLTGSQALTGGLTVSDTGLSVSAGGATFTSSGLKVAGGLTLSSSFVRAPNVIVTGTVSVLSGSVITGGFTVTNTGLKVDTATTNYITGNSDIVSGDLSILGDLNGNFLITPSDRRLKQNINPIRNSLDSVTKLRGVYFKWSKDSPQAKLHKRRKIGLVAQDVQTVFPEMISEILDGDYLGVNYLQLVPVMIEAIRELDEMYTELDNDYRELGLRSQTCACRDKNYHFV